MGDIQVTRVVAAQEAQAQVGEELDQQRVRAHVGRLGLELSVEALADEGLLVASQEVGDEVEVRSGAGVHAGPGHGLDELFGVGFEHGFEHGEGVQHSPGVIGLQVEQDVLINRASIASCLSRCCFSCRATLRAWSSASASSSLDSDSEAWVLSESTRARLHLTVDLRLAAGSGEPWAAAGRGVRQSSPPLSSWGSWDGEEKGDVCSLSVGLVSADSVRSLSSAVSQAAPSSRSAQQARSSSLGSRPSGHTSGSFSTSAQMASRSTVGNWLRGALSSPPPS